MSVVVPIKQISKGFPEAGRIRLGIKATSKAGKEYPKAIDTFRLTSQYRQPIEQAAELWGGEVQPWNSEWEVVTQTNSVDIIIPFVDGFDPLGGTPIYELWSGGGCTRRCDGETVNTPEQTGPDSVEMVESPCICQRKGILECSVKLRMILGLPDLDFYGFWRLETGSMNAVRENQGMLEAIATLQQFGIQRGVLTLERREIKKPGVKTKKFVVPVLRLAGSMNELEAGSTSLGALAQANQSVRSPELEMDRAKLGSGNEPDVQSVPEPTSSALSVDAAGVTAGGAEASSGVGAVAGEGAASAPEQTVAHTCGVCDELMPPDGAWGVHPECMDDDVVDAEIVEDNDEPTSVSNLHSGDIEHEGFTLDPAERARLRAGFMARVKGLGCDYDNVVRPWISTTYGVSGGWSKLSDEDAFNLHAALLVPDGSREQKDDAERRFVAAVTEHAEANA